MTTATECRQYAEECRTAMRAAVIPEVRAALFATAQRWAALADRLDADELPASVHDRGAPRAGGTAAPARTKAA